MLWAAAAYAAGIVAGVHLWRPLSWWIVGSIVIALASLYFVRRRAKFSWILGFAVCFLIGAFHVQARAGLQRLDAGIQPFADRQELEIIAHVVRDGHIQSAAGESRQIVDIETEQLRTDAGVSLPIRSGIRLGIYSKPSDDQAWRETSTTPRSLADSMPFLQTGQRIRFMGKLRRPRNFRNPGAFDYEGYLADHGIAALGSAKLQDVQLLPGTSGAGMAIWRSRLHRDVVRKVHQLWAPHEAALMDAMLIGEEAFIDRDTRTNFQRAGTYHVLVVS
jgi:competence protein ComEC